MVLVQNTEINAGRGEGVSDLSKRLTWQRQLVATLYLHQVEAQSLHSLMRLFASETQSETQLAVVLQSVINSTLTKKNPTSENQDYYLHTHIYVCHSI